MYVGKLFKKWKKPKEVLKDGISQCIKTEILFKKYSNRLVLYTAVPDIRLFLKFRLVTEYKIFCVDIKTNFDAPTASKFEVYHVTN